MSQKGFPEFIGPYRVLRPIAKGGMSEVVEVEDAFSGERFALKWLTRDGRARQRFDREYEAMIRLNHPSVVRVYHFGIQDQRPWMTMELVDGEPVQRYAKMIGRPGVPARTTKLISVARQMALALDHVHRRGLIHRDLKSANVLVLSDGRVKLIDFGTAKVENPIEEITADGEFVGTYAYASPEQLRGKTLTRRSDVYNLGVLFYRMFTGKLPFYGEGVYDIAKQHVEVTPTEPVERVSSLPNALNDLIMQMLEKNVERRPRSAGLVVEALDRMIGEVFEPALLPDLSIPRGRLVGRDQQLLRAESFFEHQSPGSMLVAVGSRGCGRRAFHRSLRGIIRRYKWRSYSTVFRREYPPIQTLADLCLMIGNDLDTGVDQLIQSCLVSLEGERDWTADALLEISKPMFQRLGGDYVVLFLRSLHLADKEAWRVIWGWQDQLQEQVIPWTLVGDGLDWLGTRRALPRVISQRAEVLRLPALDVLRLGTFIGSLLNRRPPPVYMTQQIHEATGGWPLHAENKIREWIRAGTLTVDGKDPNRLRWDRLAADRISPVGTYEASVRQGLSFLTEQERSVLGAVALGSQETTLDQISSLLELDKEEVSSSVQLLHRANCLHMDKESVRCLETQIVRSIITEMPKDQVGELREKLWELGLLNPLYRVTWLVDEGHIDQAVEYAAEVMEQLYNREAPISALALIDNAIEDLAELNESESRNRLWLVYIRCVMAVRPSDPAARKLFAQLGESEYRESSLFEDYVAAQLLGVIGHYPAYKERLTQAWERHHDGRPSSTLLLVGLRLAWVEEQFGDLGRVSGWFEALQSVVARLGRKSARALVTQARARVAYIQGDFDDGMRLAEKAMSTLSDIEGVSTRAEVLPVYVDFLRLQGRFSEAVMHLSEALSAARSTEMPKLVVPLLLAAARCEVDLFRLGRAQEYIDELMVSMRPGEYLHLRLEATLLWGRVLVASGEYHHAAGVLTDTAGRAKAAGLCVIDGVSSALLGHVDCFLGNTLEGDTRMSQAVEMLCDQGRHSAALECALIWARARGATLNPDIIFKPVQALVEHPFATIPRLEWLIASRRFHGSSRGIDEAIHETISSILVNSSGMERSALRVHPWTRTVKLNRENTEDDR